MDSVIRVAIADDHQPTVDGYFYRLSLESDMKVVGSAFYGEELVKLLDKHPNTDVLILDVGLPTAPDNANPYPILHIIPHLLERYRALAILIISMYTSRTLINEVIDAGAKGYILKDDHKTIRDLASVVRSVAKGDFYFSQRAFKKWQTQRKRGEAPPPTPRQREVLSLCAAYPDLTTGELAHRLNVRPSTVRNILSEAYKRLGVTNRTTAVAKARKSGLITPLDPDPQMDELRGS